MKTKNNLLGKLWNMLYIETDISEESLKELCEKIVEVIEVHDSEEKNKSKN